ncbi:MAG: hypothetical protein IPF54_14800 [Draconibacterium sp.]|nr:hypothetical protein [Draconibacterium sp.]
MKTTNKIQKTALTAALAMGFSIMGFTIDAQEEINLLTKNNGVNNFAMATVKNDNHFFAKTFNDGSSTARSSFAAYLVEETEAPLTIENWMIDDSNFSSATSIESEIETPLEIENWMIDEKTFYVNSVAIETATDEELELEDWMMNENKFEVKNNTVAPIVQTARYIFINNISFPAELTEDDLQLEDWMTNSEIWK